jgi:hypothetical protein
LLRHSYSQIRPLGPQRNQHVPLRFSDCWIAETESERAKHEITLRQATTRTSLTPAQIEQMVTELGDMATTLRDADPNDKSEVYQQLGLKLTYHPFGQLVRGAVDLNSRSHWFFDSVRGRT